MSGEISGDDLTLKLTDTTSQPECTAKVMATINRDEMSGTYLVKGGKHCKGTGTFDLTLQ